MTLGLNMIVKNESEVLERVLSSVARVMDEIVVVDTGSSDDTVAIARRFTDKVYSFEWCDDFAAARNFALSKCTTDYWMWLDADDIVPKKTSAGIARFMRNIDSSVDAVMLPYVVGRSADGKPAFSYYRERILKNKPEHVWSGLVHEAVAPVGRVVRLPYSIVHAKPSGRSAGTRNLDIYRGAAKRGEKFSPRETYYFGRELYFNGLYSEAADKLREFLATDGFYVNKIDACILLSRCYQTAGDFGGAAESVLESFIYAPPTGEGCCELGKLFFNRGDYRNAAYWYECAVRAKPDLNSGAFVDYDCYGFAPLVWLTVCYDRLGETKKAYRFHCRARRLRPYHPSIVANQAYFASLGYRTDD